MDLSDPYAGGSFSVELLAPGLRVVRPVFVFTFSDLPEYFHELAEDWRGWSGEKVWASPDYDLVIAARSSNTGHDLLTFSVQDGPVRTWIASIDVEMEAGQEATATARSIADLWATRDT